MEQLTDKRLEAIISKAIQKQLPSVAVPSDVHFDDVFKTIRVYMRQHPEVFWFSHQYRLDRHTYILYLKYNFTPRKKAFYVDEIGKAVEFLFQPSKLKHFSDFKKVAYVYKWIVNNTTYNEYSSFSQTIYSVLINRNSVCTGYAKAAQYLLGLIGVHSELVFGKFHADKSDRGRHVWNIVKIDGDWYHVDFCLADPALTHLLNSEETPVVHDGLLWNYFCKPTEYVLKNRSIEFVDSYAKCVKSINKRFYIKLSNPQERIAVCKSNSGSSSNVYLDSFDKDSVIKKTRNNLKLIANEVKMLQCLNGCKHIVKLKGRTDEDIVLEQLTPWSELLNSHYYHPNEQQLKNILIQLTEGLIECRDRGITYSDIHYNNVFVSKDGTYKWGDFGIAFSSTSDGSLPPQMIGSDGVALGSRWFMPPETYRDGVFTESSAIYSLAMLAYFVMNDMRPPFWNEYLSEQEVLCKILSTNKIDRPLYSTRFATLSKLVCEILNAEQGERIKGFEKFIESLKPTSFEILSYNKDVVFDGSSDEHVFFNVNFDSDDFARTKGIYSHCSKHREEITYSPFKTKAKPQVDDHASKSSFGIGAMIGKFINGIGGFFTGFAARAATSETQQDIQSAINACIYAPAEVRAHKFFIIRVYMYKPEEQDSIDSKVKEIDPKAVKQEYKPLDIPVSIGDKLTVQLNLSEGVSCRETTKSVVWHGHYTDCSFSAKLVDGLHESIDGTAYIFINDIPAGEMLFTIDVVESEPKERYAKIDARRFSKIFISYAHQDESQVRGIAEGCRMLGKDYFFDRHSLRAGDIFKDKILNYIDNADLFVLCWSKNAAESEWVQIEREHALKLIHEGKSSLSIYPLCLRPEAPLPLDMSDKYNFGTL